MNVLSRKQIDEASDRPRETVEVPEWGGSVLVQGMTAADRDAWEAESMPEGDGEQPRLENLRARLCARCIVNEAGKRLYSDDEAGALGAKSAAAINRLYEVARRLSGIGREAVEERAKN